MGYEGRYDISDHGEVRSRNYMHTGRSHTLAPVNYKGYQRVYLYLGDTETRRRKTIHRLVALAFIPNPQNKPQVNHKDGNKAHNHWRNLEWATCSENLTHACRTLGKGPSKGAAHGQAREFLVEIPDGQTVKIKGLKAFCDPRKLDRRAMKRTLQTKALHKGHRLIKELS